MTLRSRPIALLAAALLALSMVAFAAEHPVPLEKGATNCAECHEDKTKGKAVHSAIAMGCGTCHEVKVEGETTRIELVQPGNELCFTCHEKSTDSVRHGPYETGRCVLCHDPHASEYPRQLRAAGNDLCLGCHRPGPASPATVAVFGSQELSRAEFDAIPKIRLNDRQRGHPFNRHPITGHAKDRTEQELSCLSCHQPHSSPVQNLAFLGTVQPPDVLNRQGDPLSPCIACHVTFDWVSRQPQATVFFWRK